MGIPLTDEQLKAADVGCSERVVNLGSHKRHCTDVLSSYYILLLHYYYIVTTSHIIPHSWSRRPKISLRSRRIRQRLRVLG